MTNKPSMTNTKKEILSMYDELLEQLNNQQAGVHDPKAEVKAKNDSNVLSKAQQLSNQDITEQIAHLQKNMANVFNSLSSDFAEEMNKYNSVKEAISLKQAELKELFDIEKEAMTLTALVNSNKAFQEKYEKEMEDKKEQYRLELNNIQNQIKEEREKFNLAVKEEKQKIELEKERLQEEFEYNFERSKQKRFDDLNDELQAQKREFENATNLKEKELEEKEKELLQRENVVNVKEEKIESLEEQVAALPLKEAEMKKELEESIKAQYAKTEAIKENSIKKHFESEKNVFENKIAMLQESLDRKNDENDKLSNKLDEAYNKIQQVAIATANKPTEYRSNNQDNDRK